MMKKTKYLMGAFLLSALVFAGCDNDDEGSAPELTVEAITATGTSLDTGEETTKDLNAATSATDVPPDAVFEITFNKEVDASTATASNITITSDGAASTTNVSADGSVITVTPTEELIQGTDYTLTITSGIAGSDGGAFTNTTRTFKTAGRLPVEAPQSNTQVAYWKFDGDASDEMDNYEDGTEVEIDYQTDRFGTIASTAYFNGDASIIEVPNAASLMNDTDDFTVSFWAKTETENHVNENGDPTGMFVFGLGAHYGIQYEIFDSYDGSKFAISYETEDGTTVGEDMWFPSEATDNTNGGWQGWDYAKSLSPEQMQNIIKDTWYNVIYSYDATEKKGSLYFNGELMKSFDFDLWPEEDVKTSVKGVTYRGQAPEVVDELAFGFVQSRAGTLWDAEPWGGYDIPTSKHFKGWLDDFRIFHTAYSAEDVTNLYNAEKP
ncbi:Ig-like domain-containing protein [Marivirga sp. S37H4]|uniref:Ig-like domain-containing protein n=1 Tax=Marivirga aurantiaca TaxID=2802615 RepID=A0A934WYB4_9BACT|nr:Ig-like domain-containing protein [Marivirga aurantiaca]MBK6265051.1 Ig-like domain-containing protein [Marivirga aurantiaca]